MRRSAFTLLELLLVIGLLVLLASISLPTLRSWQLRIELDQARNAIVELISEGERRAVTEGSQWEIIPEKSPPAIVLKRQFVAGGSRSEIDPRDRRTMPRSMQIEFCRCDTDESLESLTISVLGHVIQSRIWLIQYGKRSQAFEIDRLTSTIRPVQ